MRKFLGILLVLGLVLAFSVPVMANEPGPTKTADTGATVLSGSGSPPIVKCKWETSAPAADSESGDPSHLTRGTQVDPTIDEAAQTISAIVYYWAIVTDPQGINDIREVAADVYEPAGGGGAAEEYVFKYKVVMPQCHDQNWDVIRSDLEKADAAGLVTYAEGYDLAEITGTEGELDQNSCLLFRGSAVIEGHQPGGFYNVQAYAYDQGNEVSAFLNNCFEYVRTASLVKDFTLINWGGVNICTEKTVCGDSVMFENDLDFDGFNDDTSEPNNPTLKSAGNCNLDISVEFSDMVKADRKMDEVEFDAYLISPDNRVGGILPNAPRDISHPDSTVHVQCPVCTPTKLGLSIHVIQAFPGDYTGTVTITGSDNGLPWGGINCWVV